MSREQSLTGNRPEVPPRRPLLGVAAAFAIGVVIAALSQPPAWVTGAAGFALICVAALALYRRWQVGALGLTLAAVTAVGASYFSLRATPGWTRTPEIRPDKALGVKVRGVVRALPQIQTLGTEADVSGKDVIVRFPLSVGSLLIGDTWKPFRGTVQVSGIEARDDEEAKGDRERWAPLSHLRYGDRIELTCDVSPLPRPGNPGQFDYGEYLARRGMSAVASVSRGVRARLLEGRAGFFLLRWIYDAKVSMRRYVDEHLDPGQAALLRCLVLGDRRAQPRAREAAYVKTGTVHFLAVSGLHVALLALPLWYFLTLARVGIRAASLLVMGAVTFYAVLGGLNPPILRGAVMVAVVCGGYVLRRRPNFLNSMALAAIVIMLLNPADLLTAGFQMSFAAVLGLGVFAPRIQQLFFGRSELLEQLQAAEERNAIVHHVRRYVEAGLSVGLAAWVSTVGFVVFYFHMVTPLAPLVTLVMSPILCGILCLGFPAAILGPLLGGLATPLVAAAGFLTSIFDGIAALSSRVPGTYFYLAGWGIPGVAAFYAFLVLAALAPRLRLRAARVCMVGLVVGCGFAGSSLLSRSGCYTLTALDVGQGCAVLVQLPDGANILYDCGGGRDGTVGDRIVSPFLWQKGVERLDVVVVSHADSDHWNGLDTVLDRFRVGCVVLPAESGDSPGMARLSELLQRRGARTVRMSAGDRIHVGSDTWVEVLHPRETRLPVALSANDSSCAVRIRRPEATVLLTGDLQVQGLAVLMAASENLQADVLLAPHHGHAIGNLPQFLLAVKPRLVLVSGRDAAPDYRQGMWKLFDTGSRGAVAVRFEPGRGETRLTVRLGPKEHELLTETWPSDRSQVSEAGR